MDKAKALAEIDLCIQRLQELRVAIDPAALSPSAPDETAILKQKAESYEWLKESVRQHGGIVVRMADDTMSITHGVPDEASRDELMGDLREIVALSPEGSLVQNKARAAMAKVGAA